MSALSQVLKTIDVGAPVTAGNLTVFPLLRAGAGHADYWLLDEALDANLAKVTEISEEGSVPELLFRNKSERDILLVDGEGLVGAKQNRVLNLSVLVGAGQEVKIPVSCVEVGRWQWQSRRFSAGRCKLNSRARMEKMRSVSDSIRQTGTRSRGDIQDDVWRAVDDKLSHFKFRSATSSLPEFYEAIKRDLEPFRSAFKPQAGQVGAVFAIDGGIVGAEVFDAFDTLEKLLPKLVDSYALDALESAVDLDLSEAPSVEAAKRLLKRISRAPASTYAALAKGTDVRIDDRGLHAAALIDGERTLHLSAFAVADD